jgi:hypothetical protein
VLFRPEASEPLTDEPWDGNRVREAVREIVSDTEAAFDPIDLWPADGWDAYSPDGALVTEH